MKNLKMEILKEISWIQRRFPESRDFGGYFFSEPYLKIYMEVCLDIGYPLEEAQFCGLMDTHDALSENGYEVPSWRVLNDLRMQAEKYPDVEGAITLEDVLIASNDLEYYIKKRI